MQVHRKGVLSIVSNPNHVDVVLEISIHMGEYDCALELCKSLCKSRQWGMKYVTNYKPRKRNAIKNVKAKDKKS